ncbi:NfeD family protein [Pseudoalteromonas xiamenensis]|uniref:NfeD family protein n=1 Tax=Pseudoalteromonas xiamenensis TaxID=882626 RepID=A0A975HPW1_9GAMM|nr:NfeD family protein [Pseudoalteromonas xiamenensis]QTH73645.1 NfeD family protein [Pseudoalteromonas xiamenensis]
MSWFTENLWESIAIIGIVALCIEILVFGFATFILLFLGLSCLISALSMYLGLVNESWEVALTFNAVVTVVLALLLWKPLERMQNKQDLTAVKSDFANIEFQLVEDVEPNSDNVTFSYSGISWKLKSTQPLLKGQFVRVTKKDVGIFWVMPVEKTQELDQ